MTERFKDDLVSREHRFSLGIDQETGGYCPSTPVSDLRRQPTN